MKVIIQTKISTIRERRFQCGKPNNLTRLPPAKENSLTMKIELVEYRNEWAQLFQEEKAALYAALQPAKVFIEHVGSTAVPGLAAKPIIDIMIGLPDFAIANSLVPPIIALGYDYIAEYEAMVPERRYFQKEVEKKRTHHIHMVEVGSEFWKRLLLFRDYLRMDAKAMLEYATLKKSLATREWQDMNEYAYAKTEFVKDMEKRAAITLG
jgi:GrpB-like predicted nucleotidyltransferase (UPF0157 family)